MSADTILFFVSADHHSHRVPAHQAFDPALHFLTAGERRLLANWNSVLVRSSGSKGKVDSGGTAGMQCKLLQEASGALRAAASQHVIERIQPLAGLQHLKSVIIP